MKTLEELLAAGTLDECGLQATANIKRADEIFKKTAATEEELDEGVRLTGETKSLRERIVKLQERAAAKTANVENVKAMKTPVGGPPQPQGNGGGDGAAADFNDIGFAYSGALKNFRGSDNSEANQKAYRFGKWLHGNVFLQHPGSAEAKTWCDERNIKASQSESVIADGGALVPVEFERTLIDLREQYGSFRPNAKREPMVGETKMIPRRTGGLTAYFIGEGSPSTSSSKSYDLVQLTTKKLMCVVPYSTELAEDAIINMADDLAGEIAYAFALKEDQCGFLGDGTSTYGGITGVINKLLNLSGTIANIAGIRVQATISTGTFASATIADFQGVIAKLPKYADTPRAKWYMHKTFFHSVPGALMTAQSGNRISDLQGGIGPGNMTTFLGYPVEFVQVMPTVWVANQIFALFGDLSLAASFGDRRATTLFTDPYSLSTSAQIQIIGTERFDEIVHDCGNASATATARVPGPICAFASAAS